MRLREEEQWLTMADVASTEMDRGPFSPYTIFFLLVLAPTMLNLIIVVYPLVVEGIIIGSPPFIISGLDLWAVHILFGIPTSEAASAYDVYTTFLLEVYLLSFLPAFLIAFRLLWPTFRKLLRNHELVASDRSFAAKTGLDIMVFGLFGYLALDRILAYVTQYPGELYGFPTLCLLSGYILVGYITGSCVGKIIPALWVYFVCRKQGLKFVSFHGEQQDPRRKGKHRKLVKWALLSTRPQRQ